MSIRDFFRKIIPSFRSRDAVISEIDSLRDQLKKTEKLLSKKISDLDQKNEFLIMCLTAKEGDAEEDTRQRFYRNMPKASGDTRTYQIVENYILQRLKSICDSHNIHFVLYAGTLIGAIRHQGFIPWDDDIDIAMMYDDFLVLEEVLKDDEELEVHHYCRYQYQGKSAGSIIKVKLRNSDTFFVDIYLYEFVNIQDNENESWEKTAKLSNKLHADLFDLMKKSGIVYDGTNNPTHYPQLDEAIKTMERQYRELLHEELPTEQGSTHICMALGHDISTRKANRFWPCEEMFPIQEEALLFEGKKYDSFKNNYIYLNKHHGTIWRLPSSITPGHLNERTLSIEDKEFSESLQQKDC